MTSGDKVVVARTFGAPEKRGVLLSFRKLDVHDPVRLSHVSSLLDGLPRGTKIASAFLFWSLFKADDIGFITFKVLHAGRKVDARI